MILTWGDSNSGNEFGTEHDLTTSVVKHSQKYTTLNTTEGLLIRVLNNFKIY